MQDTGEVRPDGIAEEMTEEQLQEVVRNAMNNIKDKQKKYGALNIKAVWSTVMNLPLPFPSDHAVLIEQIALLRDLLAGKNNWLDDLVKEERARNEKLLAENAALRKEAERLKIALTEVLSIDAASDEHNINSEDFERLWELTKVV